MSGLAAPVGDQLEVGELARVEREALQARRAGAERVGLGRRHDAIDEGAAVRADEGVLGEWTGTWL